MVLAASASSCVAGSWAQIGQGRALGRTRALTRGPSPPSQGSGDWGRRLGASDVAWTWPPTGVRGALLGLPLVPLLVCRLLPLRVPLLLGVRGGRGSCRSRRGEMEMEVAKDKRGEEERREGGLPGVCRVSWLRCASGSALRPSCAPGSSSSPTRHCSSFSECCRYDHL